MKFAISILTLLLSASTALACNPLYTYCAHNLSAKDQQAARDFVRANVRKLGVPGGYQMTDREVEKWVTEHMWECRAGLPPKVVMGQSCPSGQCKSRFMLNDKCYA